MPARLLTVGLLLSIAVLGGRVAGSASAATRVGGPGSRAVLPVGELEMTAIGEVLPPRLPRAVPAPAAVRLGFTSAAGDGAATPDLAGIEIDLSRNVKLRTEGLPSCSLAKLYSTAASALHSCAASLVGRGRVSSEVAVTGEAPVTIDGHLRAFYALADGRPRILAQVTSGAPLPLTYVIPFEIRKTDGIYGTSLAVPKMSRIQGQCRAAYSSCFHNPYALADAYGRISRLQMSLHRRFAGSRGRQSVVRASCPAPGGQTAATFPVARVELDYRDGAVASGVANGSCRVSGPSRSSSGADR